MEKMNPPPWSCETIPLIKLYNSSQGSGLSADQLEQARTKFGKNILRAEKKKNLFVLFIAQFKNPMMYTLLIAAVISMVLGEILDAVAILAILFLNAIIGFAQETKAEAAISALKNLTVPKARVLREGSIYTIDSSEVVPGDILILEAGDYVVADARVVEAYQLAAAEAVLTGESMPIEKNSSVIAENTELADRKNMIFSGTAISNGSGRALVTATGMNTEIGHIAGLLNKSEGQSTPLQLRLEKVSNKLLMIGVLVIFVVAFLEMMKGEGWLTIFMSSISLAVAAIPEGLPTVVTLALTLAVRRLTKKNALIRNMSAVETLGSTDVICSDKTGTLTTGKMKVREVFTLEEGVTAEEKFKGNDKLFQALVLCNNASLDHGGSGDSTEIALLMLAEQHEYNIALLREENLRTHEWSFESDRKRMSVAIKNAHSATIFCKGAPEAVLPLCLLNNEQKRQIEEAVNNLSGLGRRLLAVAWRKTDHPEVSHHHHLEIEKDLSFLGLVSIADPPKEESISSIKDCKAAGIKVVMITGDHPVTAQAIAGELGIIEKSAAAKVLTGVEINELTMDQLKSSVEIISVYARVTPEHKLKIIDALQANGHIVAMTGDGVNDAPALKKASIGVAMGKAGTEVARQASSMILTDDNFSTIVVAIEEGRAIYGNIKRTIQYLLSTNLAEILTMLGAALMGLPSPLTPLALLWINLVTDGFPSLALAAEPVEKNLLKTSKRPSPSSFFDRHFLRELFIVAFIMTLMELFVYAFVLENMGTLSARSFAFTLLVYMSLFRSFSCRSETKTFFELPFNSWHLASVIFPIVIQLSIQETKLYTDLFKVRALTLEENGLMLFLGFIPVTVVELLKLVRRK